MWKEDALVDFTTNSQRMYSVEAWRGYTTTEKFDKVSSKHLKSVLV